MTAQLVVDHISKKFCRDVRMAAAYAWRDVLAEFRLRDRGTPELRSGEFWSLKNVSFDLAAGEALAIMGANGAGKTTLLKVIANLIKPDSGEVRSFARVSTVIELGSGLSPWLTGRENIAMYAALQGVHGRPRSVLSERVIDFSGLEQVIDAPVASYSAGMRARLAFALGTQVNAAVLLLDEVLAVGDLSFQRKCIAELQRFVSAGGALILVTHNPYQAQAICRRGILLQRGQVTFEGSAVETVHELILAAMDDPGLEQQEENSSVRVTSVRMETTGKQPAFGGSPLRLTVSCVAEEVTDVVWGFSIWSADTAVCITSGYDMRPRTISGPTELSCIIVDARLAGGRYWMRPMIADRSTLAPLVGPSAGAPFDVLTQPDLVQNAQLHQGQLIDVDVHWG